MNSVEFSCIYYLNPPMSGPSKFSRIHQNSFELTEFNRMIQFLVPPDWHALEYISKFKHDRRWEISVRLVSGNRIDSTDCQPWPEYSRHHLKIQASSRIVKFLRSKYVLGLPTGAISYLSSSFKLR